MFSKRVVELGAGIMVSPESPENFTPAIDALLDDERYLACAQRFAAQYTDFDPRDGIRIRSDKDRQR